MPYGVDYGDTERRLATAIAEVSGTKPPGTTPGNTVVLRTPININTVGDNTIIAAVANQKVKILGLLIVSAGDVNLTIKSGTGTNLTGAIPLAAKGNGFVLPTAALGYHLIETAPSAALVFNLSTAVSVTGALAYLQEA